MLAFIHSRVCLWFCGKSMSSTCLCKPDAHDIQHDLSIIHRVGERTSDCLYSVLMDNAMPLLI